MKKLFLIFSVLVVTGLTFAQIENYPIPGQGNFEGGLGLNWIEGNLYYTFHLRPEISFANFGVGLDLNLDIDKSGNIRKEDFNEFSDYLSIIRYIRYGVKNDPVYIKLGALDYYTLGYGNIILNYNNSPSFDSRKIGLVTDIDFGEFGFESIYSNFLETGVVGLRAYFKPLKFTDAANIPVIGNLIVGASYAVDFNQYAGVVFTQKLLPTESVIPRYVVESNDQGSMNTMGIDLGLPILSTSMLSLQLYTDATKIINYGSGFAAGIKADINVLSMVKASVQLERRFNNAQYIAGYFNSIYEIERYSADSSSGIFSSKATTLANLINPDNGYFGELYADVLGLFSILGSYERLDKTPNSGILHLQTNIAPDNTSFVARAGYDRINIGSETEIFKLDDRSYLYFEYGYKPNPYILLSMLYSWTFTPVYDSNNNIIDYRTQKRIEPRISFVCPLNFSGGN